MTFLLTHVGDEHPGDMAPPTRAAGWLSVRCQHDMHGWTVVVDWPRRRGWPDFLGELAPASAARWSYALLADVDRTMVYNDAYGHIPGDLMLTRVHASLESVALRLGAPFLQVGGEEFAMLVDATGSEAHRVADALRRGVEALNIPFAHPEVRTLGRVTVSVGVSPVAPGAGLRERLEAAVDAAKRAGRNRVSSDG